MPPPERRHRSWVDVVVAAALLAFGLVGSGPAARSQGMPDLDTVAYVLVVVACVPLALTRRHPMRTFAVTGLAVMAYVALGYAYGPILFACLVAVYTMASRYPPRVAVPAVVALLGLTAVAVLVRGAATGATGWDQLLDVPAWVIAPAAAGLTVRARREFQAGLRDEQVRRVLTEERLTLAQEVHDVVGHGLAVIAMQAGAALHVLDRNPGQARESLEAIRSTSKESLAGLRAELDALRGQTGQSEPRWPGVGLADVPALAARMRSTGLPVLLDLDACLAPSRRVATHDRSDGDGSRAQVDQVAYRIVQESLTNVLRHAGPKATASVRVRRTGNELLVEVADTGCGGTAHPGYGIAGMRRRALAVGGRLEAGPAPDGGFVVRAHLPVRGSAT
ncbi:sensor histidine kinase [Actinopolymorpha pittospori]|uniref:histidine kinase n=1 Tax=Actinopolymorpha pittospori TaxID=648752 RepID=A0A927MQP9_9ACTN|nr:histidine kinase [Actinopolymorpha pittospori]MBE1604929.1 signal transduction histidine kinase [Actinopolymorpha pittospori]